MSRSGAAHPSLRHPDDLESWLAWQRTRQPLLRRIRGRVRDDPPPALLAAPAGPLGVLVSLGSTNPSSMAALVDPVRGPSRVPVGIISPRDCSDLLGGDTRTTQVDSADDIERRHGPVPVTVVPSGIDRAHRIAIAATRRSGGQVFVVQHGLLTPFAPPLPRDCTLLAWSEADGEFWRSGRGDVEVEVVGSQLLWAAARRPAVHVDTGAPVTFLGQLHAAELDRRELARVSYRFCTEYDGHYRPHPSESDRFSRLQHALWKRRGVGFDTSGVPLDELATPVAAIFSTGILEAAAAGRPAWAYHPDPPAWVAEMWDRYGLRRWGEEPTPAPEVPAEEPAVRVAAILAAAAQAQEA